MKYAVALKNDMLQKIIDDIGASGLMRWYSGTQPTNPDTALSGNTKLAELPLSATAGTKSGGVMTFNAITTEASADATGTATWGTFCTSGGTRIVDFTIGTSGAELNLNSVAITAGSQASCSSAAITSNN